MVQQQFRATHVVIDSRAYQHNLAVVRSLVPNKRVMAIIKSDGYGHGMQLAADALNDADEFGVTCQDDAERLRRHGVSKPLTLLSGRYTAPQLSQFGDRRWRPVVYDDTQLTAFDNLSAGAAIDVWIKIDTGMGRLGFYPHDLADVYQRLRSNPRVGSISLMTHLANADYPEHPSNRYQIARFKESLSQFDFAEASILNSAGTLGFSDSAFDIVRTGLVLYGIAPQARGHATALPLKPVMQFRSQLLSVRAMSAGSPIGYGSTYTLESDTRVGIIAAGYGDGYPRHAPTGTPVYVNGYTVPLIGRVSMDLITVDLGTVDARVGDAVVLWGAENPVELVAEKAGTIAYELTCGITPRVERLTI
ncbi:alanine racemase [Arenicella chitinivorans]|uniref:alanine racemase n=1 Tax=Arenicella chitinivorans TaxID=1329800 RepID=UPI0016733AC6|nr:alanine racemase [Arenicella chitinivorans]